MNYRWIITNFLCFSLIVFRKFSCASWWIFFILLTVTLVAGHTYRHYMDRFRGGRRLKTFRMSHFLVAVSLKKPLRCVWSRLLKSNTDSYAWSQEHKFHNLWSKGSIVSRYTTSWISPLSLTTNATATCHLLTHCNTIRGMLPYHLLFEWNSECNNYAGE